MIKKMNIRKANDLDKRDVLNFCKNTFEWGDYIDKVWDIWINDSKGLLLVSEIYEHRSLKSIPVAISHISICPNNLMWIEGLRVDKNYRKQGLAHSLLKYMLDYGKKKELYEADAIVSLTNIASQKLLEKQGFNQLFKFNYFNIQLKREIQFINSGTRTQKLKLKIPYQKDIPHIKNYFDRFKVKYMDNRYFSSWKFYKIENTFSGLFSLVVNNKVLLVVDDSNNINGILMINFDDYDTLYKRRLIQICYLDCIDNSIYSDVIKFLISVYSNNTLYNYIHFFIPDFIDLNNYISNEFINSFEQFYLYSKHLK